MARVTLIETEYKCYVCDLRDQQEPIVVLIQGKEKAPPGPTVAKKLQSRKVMIISKKVCCLRWFLAILIVPPG